MSDQTSTLTLLFPHVSENVLMKTLDSANGDVEMATNMILSEQESLNRMRTMSAVSDVDFENGNDETLPSSVDEKSSQERPKEQRNAVNLKKRLYRPAHSFDKVRPADTISVSSPNKTWSSTQNQIRKVVDLTDVPFKIAQTAFYKKSLSAARAAIDIIHHYDDYVSDFKSFPSPPPAPPSQLSSHLAPVRVGGRVQSVQGLAHRRGGATAASKENDFRAATRHSESIPPIIACATSPESLAETSCDLDATIASNPLLKSISPSFFKLVLKFYAGDVVRTTMLAAFIIDNNCSRYTFTEATSAPAYDAAGKLQPQVKIVAGTPEPTAYSKPDFHGLVPSSFTSADNYNQALQVFENVFRTHTADLHGFLPQEAAKLAQMCLSNWWDNETSLREMNAHRPNLIKAQNIAPLKIITGRGLHSLGGVSKVRIKIKKLLDSNNYVYTEEPSYFIIEGRRSTTSSRKR
ncbi:LAME_0G16204g1_1 [Lachancea meyersii CBS 8951]|uniref:LAME_0G16204g1_1 n=1 Tax=Lachancea meyersii CBS 8951 TaxID=1266667 RepID=A0A1G4KAZ9_9SACH|nr:LAME_0G16204g1_1 [Lachancea meyersii CBS 8951]